MNEKRTFPHWRVLLLGGSGEDVRPTGAWKVFAPQKVGE